MSTNVISSINGGMYIRNQRLQVIDTWSLRNWLVCSYTSAHVLLTLLNELRKRDKMQGWPSILSLFRNEFNKFNNTGTRMLDSFFQMTLKSIKTRIFGVKTSRLCHLSRNVIMDVVT